MRIVIAFLLLLNLLLYLGIRMTPSEQTVDPVAPPDVGTLRLWSEVLQANSDRDSNDERSILEDGKVATLAAAPESATSTEPLPRLPQAALPEFAPGDASEAVAAVVNDEPVAGPAEAAMEPDELNSPDSATGDMVCGQLRWFDNVEAANALVAQFNGFEVSAELISEPIEQRTGYWVLIPRQPSRAAALLKREELRSVGVEDLWLFRKGPLLNSISVGLFTRNRRAQRRADEIRLLGFEVEVQPKMKIITERYAVSYRTDRRNAELIRDRYSRGGALENQIAPCR